MVVFIYWIIFCFLCLSFISEKYDYIGKLLKPGEAPTDYSDEESTAEGDKKDT